MLRHCLVNEFAQMLQVRAAHACAAFLCGRRNTCNGDQFLCEFQQWRNCLFRFGLLTVHPINPKIPPKTCLPERSEGGSRFRQRLLAVAGARRT
jgi:hypothetical protein